MTHTRHNACTHTTDLHSGNSGKATVIDAPVKVMNRAEPLFTEDSVETEVVNGDWNANLCVCMHYTAIGMPTCVYMH